MRVLRDLALQVSKPAIRAELLLDLAEAAVDYGDSDEADEALGASSRIVDQLTVADEHPSATALLARIARLRAKFEGSIEATDRYVEQAIALLRSTVREDPGSAETRAALADTLADSAELHMYRGDLGAARRAVAEVSSLIDDSALGTRPKTLESLATVIVLEAFLSGRSQRAIEVVESLLLQAVDAGWCSTATTLGSYLVGLNSTRGDYEEALRWHDRISSSLLDGARPGPRTQLAIQTAHAYTRLGRPADALRSLNRVKPGSACPPWDVPYWQSERAQALSRLGDFRAALDEARNALAGFEAHGTQRGRGHALRTMAICCAKLGNARAAREHIAEAIGLSEQYGTPYQLLTTLIAKADILNDSVVRAEAIEFARMLSRLG